MSLNHGIAKSKKMKWQMLWAYKKHLGMRWTTSTFKFFRDQKCWLLKKNQTWKSSIMVPHYLWPNYYHSLKITN